MRVSVLESRRIPYIFLASRYPISEPKARNQKQRITFDTDNESEKTE